MRNLISAFVVLMALPVVATAQPVSGLYIGAGAGTNWRLVSSGNDYSNEFSARSADSSHYQVKASLGAVGLASVGWGFGNGLRTELEGNFRQNRARTGNVDGFAFRASGNVGTWGAMANAFYDFNGLLPMVTPYVGVGIGYGVSDWSAHPRDPELAARLGGHHGSRGGNLAYQAILGVSYSLDNLVPGLSLTAEARYYATLPAKERATIGNCATFGCDIIHTKMTNENISALVGVRYAFGTGRARVAAPPAPAQLEAPAAAPMPSMARTYLVYFDWNRADLTARARDIIKDAATNARSTSVTRIEVAGHADRSGDQGYNQRLSQRRAEAVAGELQRDGISRSAISIAAFGESRPLVQTADNVRESENRRVEIVLR